MQSGTIDQIAGSVERITFYSDESGYSVIRLLPDSRGMLPFPYASGRDGLITVVGNLPEVNPGEYLRLTGRWMNHPRHGRQFQADTCEQVLPASLTGIKRYLGSGMIRGVGKVMAERIVDRFGEETLDIIEFEPQRLRSVLGIGPKRIQRIVLAWEEQKAIKNVMIFLQGHGVSTGLAIKIYKKYGDDSLQVVQKTPYRLVQDIHGIGFKTADKIARALGLDHDDPARIEAGIAFTLNRMAEEGHVYVPQDELEPEAAEILAVSPDKIVAVIESLETEALIKRDTIVYEIPQAAADALSQPVLHEEQAVYLTPLFYSEIGVTNRLRRMVHHPTSRLQSMHQPGLLDQLLRKNAQQRHHSLSIQQEDAVRAAIQNKVAIVTGGPGTGKTTTMRVLLDVLEGRRHTVALASPTGRAAKRLAEATGREAKTIHRLLEFKPGAGFGVNENNPLDVDIVVIDEASMLDLVLTNNLLKAITADTHLLLVGDVDQLPSVGAGDVLRDLIASGIAFVVRLDTIFRQAAGSLIIQNAHRINQGQFPNTGGEDADFFIFVKEDPDELVDLLINLVAKRIPRKFGLDPKADIQVLSPMYNGPTGVTNLNMLLQSALNPAHSRKPERRLTGRVFRAGDKVMQTVNNYDKNVYNGDIGLITSIDPVQQIMQVNVDGMPVVYDFLEADELAHAYAISVHKSQGSEYPCVVMPVTTQHYLMLQRNLLYTAITRARKLVILAGTRRAIRIAIRNNKVTQRHTALDYRLKKDARAAAGAK